MDTEWTKVAGHQIKGSEGKQAVVLVPGAGLYTVDGKPVNYSISEAKKRRVHVPSEWASFFAPESVTPEPDPSTGTLDLSGLTASPASRTTSEVVEVKHRGITVKERRPVGRPRKS